MHHCANERYNQNKQRSSHVADHLMIGGGIYGPIKQFPGQSYDMANGLAIQQQQYGGYNYQLPQQGQQLPIYPGSASIPPSYLIPSQPHQLSVPTEAHNIPKCVSNGIPMAYEHFQSQNILTNDADVREYFETQHPSRREFCDMMKKRYNAPYNDSLEAWHDLYNEKAREYEKLKKEREKYQYILRQLLPHLQLLVERQSVNKIDEFHLDDSTYIDSDCAEWQTSVPIDENDEISYSGCGNK